MFDILEPKECVVADFNMEIAESTRRILAERLPTVTADEPETPAPRKEQLKEWRDKGKELFTEAYTNLAARVQSGTVREKLSAADYSVDDSNLAIVHLVAAINTAVGSCKRGVSPYVLAGIFSAAKASMYTGGIQLDTGEKLRLFTAMCKAPSSTTISEDRLVACASAYAAHYGFVKYIDACLQAEGVVLGAYSNYKRMVSGHYVYDITGMTSTEKGVAYIHGFIGVDSILSLRWQSMRAGAAIKQIGGTDETAKYAADALRMLSKYTYKLYPNDYPFGEVYTDFDDESKSLGIGSCMSGSANSTFDADEVPYGIHPCDTYSSAYFGAGDNGLVLVVAYQDERAVGRGILNVQRGELVRWYGAHAAWVQFKNKTGFCQGGDALVDSWLALVADSGRFAHPYVDGDDQYGEVDTDTKRVLLCTGTHDLEYTRGYSYCEETHTCTYEGNTTLNQK